MSRPPTLLLTCEHGGNRLPRRYAALFAGARGALDSHAGYDPGALAVARLLASRLSAPLVACTTTRLLVDANRSPHNPGVFSRWTRALSPAARQELLREHHLPHWNEVRRRIHRLGGSGRPVLHVAVHSFTPVLRGRRRAFEVGLLYDPARTRERALAGRWRQAIRETAPELRVRRNAPYRGSADGLTTALRRELPAARYLGLELELNQRSLREPANRRALAALMTRCLERLLDRS